MEKDTSLSTTRKLSDCTNTRQNRLWDKKLFLEVNSGALSMTKDIFIRKKVRLFLVADDVISYTENPDEHTHTHPHPALTSAFSKVEGSKINVQNELHCVSIL